MSAEKPHKEIAQWIYDNYPVGGWWSQMLTVEYEKEKDLRKLYQKPKGFEISVSKTFGIPLKNLYNYFVNIKLRKNWLVEDIEVTTKSIDKSFRAKWNHGFTRISVNFYSVGNKKSRAVVRHLKLKDSAQAVSKKKLCAKKLYMLEKINNKD
ncbi:MAG: hypothetical protein HGGPFJEG_02210 [Ignavibacteria bacterium]|nr:hypothetical protein [Ignavibacteria bacterium]